ESLPRARSLYASALTLLNSAAIRQADNACQELVTSFRDSFDTVFRTEPLWAPVVQELTHINDVSRLTTTLSQIRQIFGTREVAGVQLNQALTAATEAAQSTSITTSLGKLIPLTDRFVEIERVLLARPFVSETASELGSSEATISGEGALTFGVIKRPPALA